MREYVVFLSLLIIALSKGERNSTVRNTRQGALGSLGSLGPLGPLGPLDPLGPLGQVGPVGPVLFTPEITNTQAVPNAPVGANLGFLPNGPIIGVVPNAQVAPNAQVIPNTQVLPNAQVIPNAPLLPNVPFLQNAPNTPGLPNVPPQNSPVLQIDPFSMHLQRAANQDPLLAAYMLGSNFGLHPKNFGYNHPQHLAINPYLALLLSHYGRYIPVYGAGKGIYGYGAANNYHNNKPFGSYKYIKDL